MILIKERQWKLILRMVFSDYTKRRILFYRTKGYYAPTIVDLLQKEDIQVSRRSVSDFLIRFKQTGDIARRAGSGRPSKQTEDVKAIIETAMHVDDETTVKELWEQLSTQGIFLSQRTVLRCRTDLGWTARGTAYCQMIRETNKVKRLSWAREHLHEVEQGFLDVIFTDESSIQMESHRRYCCRKKGEPPVYKPRYSTFFSSVLRVCMCIKFKNRSGLTYEVCKALIHVATATASIPVHERVQNMLL